MRVVAGEETCGCCRFWHNSEPTQELSWDSLGTCHRRSPRFVTGHRTDGVWPDVWAVEWCGEYEAKPCSSEAEK